MSGGVLGTQLIDVLRRPGRFLLTGLSVLVAAFVVFGTMLAYQIVTNTTLDTFSNNSPSVSLVVHSPSGNQLTPQQMAGIRQTPGVQQTAGRATAVFTVGDTTSGSNLEIIADPGPGPLSLVTVVTGTYPTGNRQIALDRRAADRLGAKPGTTLRLRGGDRGGAATKVTVTGVVDGPQAAAERAFAPDHVVGALAGNPGFERVDVLAWPGADLTAMMTHLGDQVLRGPQAFSITTGENMRVQEARAAVRQFDQIFALVAMFIAIAVVAAALVATSTFRIVFAQRLRQLALLRTIGAQRSQLVRALALEGAVVVSANVLLYLVGVGALAFGTLITLGPLLIRPVLAVAGWPLRWLGPTGRLAVSGIGGTPRRAAAVSVVVALGVTMLTGTVVGTSSIQTWTDQTMAVRTPADLAMFAEDAPIDNKVLTRLRADPRVRHVTPLRMIGLSSSVEGTSYTAIDLNPGALPALSAMRASHGSIHAIGPGKVILSAALATDLNADVGETVTLKTETGRAVRVNVAAILGGEAPLRTDALLTPADLTRLGATPTPTGVLADVGDASRTEALAAFREAAGTINAEVAVLADERDQTNAAVSSLLAAALGLLGLTVLIAAVGVGTTTGLSVLERTQESGLLRALGLTRGRLKAMVSMEAGLYGIIGAIIGTALGVPLAWLTLQALKLDLPFTLPAGQLLLIIIAVTLITTAAGLLPARRAAKVSPIAALTAE